MNKNEETYFGGHAKSTSKAPTWATPDSDVIEWIDEWIDGGFIKEYLDYATECGITPTIYHVATVLNIVSYALANCEIVVRGFSRDEHGKIIEKAGNRKHHIVPVMWSAIIGESGDRKSTAMDFGARILKEAIKGTDLEYGEAPDFASPEALTEHMAEHGPVFTFRDELSTLLTQSRRAHLEHMKSTLLLIYEHTSLKRRKVKDTSKKNNDEEEGPVEAYQVTVEKPIKMILGCIPPRVFAKQTSIDDWDTGLLPRFTYWPGFLDILATEITSFDTDPTEERRLSKQLKKFFLGRSGKGLNIIVPFDVNYEISSWVRERIDPLRGEVSGAFYAYLKRSYTTVMRIAAILALGELAPGETPKRAISVEKHHAEAAISLLDLINPRLMDLFEHTKLDRNGTREEALLRLITEAKRGITINDLLLKLDDAPSRSLIAKEVRTLEKAQLVKHKVLPQLMGRASNLYYTPEHKAKVIQRLYEAEKELKDIRREKEKLRKRELRALEKTKKENMENRV